MKLEVHNYIYNKFHERGMKAFEKKVAKILRSKGLTQGTFICSNAYMIRGNGSGSYYKCIELSFGGHNFDTIKEYTNDSVLWDDWENPTAKEKRNLFLSVFENAEFDLFSYWELLPKKVIKVIDGFNDDNSGYYENCKIFVEQLNKLSYTCEYGLDNIPYNLKKL